MDDFYLAQMGHVLAEGVCYDTSLRREEWSAWAIRAAAARHHFQTLDFLAHSLVEDGVG
jgi:hypothetical protein